MVRCRECNKTIEWKEALDNAWTKKSIEYDGLCTLCKKDLEKKKKEEMRKKALEIIDKYG